MVRKTMISRIRIGETVRRFAADDSGATAVEYGLLVAFIALAIVVAVNQLGARIAAIFNSLSASLSTR